MTINKSEVLAYIKDQIGISLELCDYFTEIKDFNGKPYFNVILNDRVSESRQFAKLERLAIQSNVISEIQPNGVCRVAIVCN